MTRRRRCACLAAALLVAAPRVRAGWVDPDTPPAARTTTSHADGDTREYSLVFSDEFAQDGRSFDDGFDPRWTALDKNDYTNEALHYYRPENVRTTNGVLNVSTVHRTNKYKAFNEKTRKYYTDAKHVQSGMLQGWNKFCLTGGIVEFRAKLPGTPHTGGLWPALWMLGNLARATYVGSSDHVWPYSYNQCDEAHRASQAVSRCSRVGHYGMAPGVGRGSPEIDVLEAMMGSPDKLPSTNITRPYFSTSLQVAPGLESGRPNMGQLPKRGHWYEGLEYGSNHTQLNPFFYGVLLEHTPKRYTYQSDAISANTRLKKEHFTGHHKYRVEWEPPNPDGTEGYIKWFLDGAFLYGIKGENLRLTNAEIPSEPMYLLINTAVASSWGFPKPCPDGCQCDCYECGNPECLCGLPDGFCENFPGFFEIDYVRAYQATNEARHVLGCSPPDRPTSQFIQGHKKAYVNAEEGQKEPLQPVRRGGSPCTTDGDCGGPAKGTCTASRRCTCAEDYTGPTCLSHDGFDDDPPRAEELEVGRLLVQPAFAAALAIASVAFLSFVALAVCERRRRRRLADRYEHPSVAYGAAPRSGDERIPAQHQGAESRTYRPSSEPAYNPMVANKLDTVTYHMIDGRLIDE